MNRSNVSTFKRSRARLQWYDLRRCRFSFTRRRTIEALRGRAPNACVDISGCYPERGLVEALVEEIRSRGPTVLTEEHFAAAV